MTAEYIYELVINKKDIILSLSTYKERIEMIINIAKQAPLPEGTPSQFAFFETLNIESDALIQCLELSKQAGRCLVIPNNEFSREESENIQRVLNKIYDLCEQVGARH